MLFLLFSLLIYKLNAPRIYRIVTLIVSLVFLGFYLKGYLCPIGAFQNIAILKKDIFLTENLTTLLLFIIPSAFIIFGGRIFCGSVCPMGSLQELLFNLGTKLKLNRGGSGKSIPDFMHYFKYFFMTGIITFTLILGIPVFCGIDPFQTLFSFSGTVVSIVLLVMVTLVSLFISRFWCRVVCPYGAFLALLSEILRLLKIKTGSPKIDADSCKSCSLCSNNCPVHAIHSNVIDSAECISCGKCKTVCHFKSCK